MFSLLFHHGSHHIRWSSPWFFSAKGSLGLQCRGSVLWCACRMIRARLTSWWESQNNNSVGRLQPQLDVSPRFVASWTFKAQAWDLSFSASWRLPLVSLSTPTHAGSWCRPEVQTTIGSGHLASRKSTSSLHNQNTSWKRSEREHVLVENNEIPMRSCGQTRCTKESRSAAFVDEEVWGAW